MRGSRVVEQPCTMGRGPDHNRLVRDELLRAVDPVEGWLQQGEAWVLYSVAIAMRNPRRAVEIGSYKGRSTIAIGRGVRDGGGGELVAIDPHEEVIGDLPDGDERYQQFLMNIQNAGIGPVVRPMRLTSHEARAHVPDGSVSMLFVDGSHRYADVVQDIDDWLTALCQGAVVCFNDHVLPEVAWAIRDRTGSGSPLRNPRWRDNTLIFDYDPARRWSMRNGLDRLRLRGFLPFGWRWVRLLDRCGSSGRVGTLLARALWHMGRLYLRLLLPEIRT